MIEKLNELFGSIVKSLEILYVIEDKKPCARIFSHEKILYKVKSFLTDNDLCFAVSDFKVLKQNVGNYSDKSIQISVDDSREAYFVVYVSKSKETVSDAKRFESENNHLNLGLFLGYPKCCCKFFEEHFNSFNTDLTLDVLKNSKGFKFSFLNNVCLRHFDISLLSHFPCSFDCEESKQIAKKNLEVIDLYSKEVYDTFVDSLKTIVLYSNGEGVFCLKNFKITKDSDNFFVNYDDFIFTKQSKLYYLLNSNDKLKIVDKNCFEVDSEFVKNLGVMVFE